MRIKLAIIFVSLMGLSLVTSVAATNILTFLLLVVALFFVRRSNIEILLDSNEKLFLCLIALICLWDVFANIYNGNTILLSLYALIHDMRTLGFILILWPLFRVPEVSRAALWSLLCSFIVLASINLFLTILGFVEQGKYFWLTAPHMYGQMLVGMFFLLAQMLLLRPDLSWRCMLPMLLLLISLFFASGRRTGYIQLFIGALFWCWLNYKMLIKFKNKGLFWSAALFIVIAAIFSPIFESRISEIWIQLQSFLNQNSVERTAKDTAIGIRLQYYISVWELIKDNNWLVGTGTINFPENFWLVNHKMGAEDPNLFSNPHNEYLYMLATKGAVGLLMYLGIFLQASRMALVKKDQLQRIGLIMFIFLFMLSITTNSMMIDMEEGHFTMLILLIFLAPKSLHLIKT
jgi:O-antigen ligase